MDTLKSEFLKLNMNDVAKGAVVVVLVSILGMVQQALHLHGLDLAHYDWSTILSTAFDAGIAYLIKNLLSDEQGKVLGKIG